MDYQNIEQPFGLKQYPLETVVTRYFCALCGYSYNTKDEALSCQSKPVTHDKGMSIGDIVRITAGDGRGELARVTRVGIFDKYYGHYYWRLYWHTVFIEAKLIDSWGTRTLPFDSYEPISSE